MEHSRENQLELVVSNSSTSLEECLHAQKDLFRSQIDELENIVLTQCKLTGVNPLSQEMAAGALSIKIGKRPRDLLNPKALKYMQSIFSIKDAISKKETREISALFGVTATQVREFFTSQRSRVRKFVRLAREKANRSSSGKEILEVHEGIPPISDPNEPLDPVPLDSVAPVSSEEGPTCSKEDEALPAVDESDKHFVENIFNLMRKEETFSGQVKLMEWVLQIQNSSILYWFLTKGGIMILATWLSQAVIEEQTSVLHVILKVLCHLPLQKALPVHMSAVLQSVNSLRFYRASDISNRARILLSRWSKAFARSQALKKKNGTKSASDSQDDILLKQSISEVMGNGSWDCRIDAIEDVSMPLDESSGSVRKLESQPLKLLTASTDDTNKKLTSGVRSSQNRERRKVLFVEQPCQKSAGRSSLVGRATAATQGRPLSADDIQKAKMRAQFIQNRYGKNNMSSNESSLLQIEATNKINSSEMSNLQSASKAHGGHLVEEQKISETSPLMISNLQDASVHNKMTSIAEEPPQKKCKRVQIPWQSPPEIILSVSWRVGTGENSKEVEVQKKRIHREREIVYKSIHEVPSDPREPWDREIDYDDTLTPEIPIEQLPDAECAETSVDSHRENEGTATSGTSLSFQNAGGSMPEPDMELLAVLLKNPELVFALTSGQANNLSNGETVKLLDMIKANSSSSSSLSVLGGNGKTEEKVEVSLPSPTPSSNPVTNGWKADLSKNPFSRQTMDSNEMQGIAGITAATEVRSQHTVPTSSLVPTTVHPTRSMLLAEHSTSVLQLAQQTLTAAAQPQVLSISTTIVPSQQLGSVTQTGQQLPLLQSALGRHETVASPSQPVGHAYASHMQQLAASELLLKTNTTRSNIVSTPAMQVETARIVNPSALPNVTPPRSLSTWANTPMHHPSYAPEPPASHSWRPRQAMDQIPYHQSNMNLNNYNPLSRGSVRAPMQPGSWEKNDLADEPDFESWSPENSPIRSHRYNNSHGWNFPQSRLNPGYSYTSSERPKSHGNPSPSGYRDLGKSGNKRWNDRGR